MKDQHTKITGYRELCQSEIDAMNKIKALANEVGALIDSMDGPVGDDANGRFFPDGRWLSIAKTDLQKGFMSLVRSVAKPESF